MTGQITINDSLNSTNSSAITLQNLNVKIELTNEQLKNIRKKIVDYPSITEIEKQIPEYNSFILEQKKEYQNFKQSHPNKQKVINIINKWKSYNAYLDTWQSTINKFLNKNLIWLDGLNKKQVEWDLTYKKSEAPNTPVIVRKNILNTQKKITATIQEVNKQNNHFLSLENKILIQKESINTIIDELESWKISPEFSIFHKRHPIIWVKEENNVSASKGVFKAWISFEENLRGVVAYYKSPENKVLAHLIFLVIIFVWLWRLRSSFKKISFSAGESKLIESKNLVVSHLKASMIFIAALSSMVYFSNTPNLLSELLLLIGLLATLPLLKPSIHHRFKGIITFIILLFVLNTIKSYVWYTSFFYRAYLFSETIMIILIALKMTFPYLITRKLRLNSFSIFLVRLSPLVYILMSIALVSNILGYTNLTDLMLSITISGASLLVILSGTIIVLGNISTAAIHYYTAKSDLFDISYKFFLEKRAQQVVILFSYLFIILYFLQVIDVSDVVFSWLGEQLSLPINVGVITFTIGSVLTFLLILFGSFAITSFISRIVDGGLLNFLKLPKGIPSVISVIVRYSIISFAFVIAMSSIGINLSQFNLMAGALGLGIGFGLQNIISNFISGLILIFERPIQTEDVVEVGTLVGHVMKIGVRSSNIRTFDGAEVVVPNSNLITNEVINWTLSDNVKRVEIKIGTAYGTDLQVVVDILIKVAAAHTDVLNDPAPVALFDQFGDSSLDFRLLYWVPVEFGITSKSEISIAVYNAFKEEKITIPFPQRDINLSKENIKTLKGED